METPKLVKEAGRRWSAPTPKRLKEIQKTLIFLLTTLTALVGGNIAVEGTEYAINLSPFLTSLIEKSIPAIAVFAFLLQFASVEHVDEA